jgi:hypothetical protein
MRPAAAGDRKRDFAKVEQERCDEGKQAEHATAFDEYRRIADARVWVGEDRAVAVPERGQVGFWRTRQRRAAKSGAYRYRGQDDEPAQQW